MRAGATRPSVTALFFLYMLGIFAWRQISKAPRVQRVIHGACMGAGLQWYSLLLVGCFAMALRTLSEFYVSYYGLDPSDVVGNLERCYAANGDMIRDNVTFQEFQARLSMPPPLQLFSILSILAGIPVLMVATSHIFIKFAYPGMRIVQECGCREVSRTPWWPAPRMNRLITLMLMPTVLSVMAMRGSCRIWALTTGQAHDFVFSSFDRVKKWEMALYGMDQEVGETFQFVSVYAFGRLCGSFLNEVLGEAEVGLQNSSTSELAGTAKEFRQLVRYAGFLPIWAYIVVGVLRCFVEFLVLSSRYLEFEEENLLRLEPVLGPAGIVFSFLAFMCVVNMYIVGWTRTIRQRLGDANLKFMGARMLLLIIAVQEQALTVLVPGTALHRRAAAKATAHDLDFSAIELTQLQADLLHLSLLNFECLFVVVFNAFVWKDLDLRATGVALYGYYGETRRRRLLLSVGLCSICHDEEEPYDFEDLSADDSSSSSSASSIQPRGEQHATLLDKLVC